MPRLIFAVVGLLTILNTLPATALGAAIPAADSLIAFASREQAIAILDVDDAYTSRMSPFDRMLRMKSTTPVTETRFLEQVAANALDWSDAERARITPLLQRLGKALAGYRLPLPPQVLLIKSTGSVEIGDAYTRANAIVLPKTSLAEDDAGLYFLIAHELFHVMTRHDPRFRALAYAQIGFRIGPEVQLPEAIAPLQITNPDAPRHDSFIDVRANGRTITVVPILLSRSAVFDPEIGDTLDRYWSLRLLAITQPASGSRPTAPFQYGAPTAQLRNGAPLLLRLNQVDGFIQQIGTNTRYIIHPEEVLAENFALLVTGAEVAEPERIEALRQLLKHYGEATRAAAPDHRCMHCQRAATARHLSLQRHLDEVRLQERIAVLVGKQCRLTARVPEQHGIVAAEIPVANQVNETGGSPAGVHRVEQHAFGLREKADRFAFGLCHHAIAGPAIGIGRQHVITSEFDAVAEVFRRLRRQRRNMRFEPVLGFVNADAQNLARIAA